MLPSLDADGWELESALERHRRAPRTFSIPTAEERSTLAVGSLVKLLFLIPGRDETGSPYVQGERMWVVVEEVRDGPEYRGTLESQPQTAGARYSAEPPSGSAPSMSPLSSYPGGIHAIRVICGTTARRTGTTSTREVLTAEC